MAQVTAPLAATAYTGNHLRAEPAMTQYHTHLVVLNEDNRPVLVLCGRAKPASIIDDQIMWSQNPPTCPACRRVWAKQKEPAK